MASFPIVLLNLMVIITGFKVSATTTVAPSCTNAYSDCAKLGPTICSGATNILWATKNCQAFCGLCPTVSMAAATSAPNNTMATTQGTCSEGFVRCTDGRCEPYERLCGNNTVKPTVAGSTYGDFSTSPTTPTTQIPSTSPTTTLNMMTSSQGISNVTDAVGINGSSVTPGSGTCTEGFVQCTDGRCEPYEGLCGVYTGTTRHHTGTTFGDFTTARPTSSTVPPPTPLGLSTTPQSTTAAPVVCVDKDGFCKYLDYHVNVCNDSVSARELCPLTCGICGTPPTNPAVTGSNIVTGSTMLKSTTTRGPTTYRPGGPELCLNGWELCGNGVCEPFHWLCEEPQLPQIG